MINELIFSLLYFISVLVLSFYYTKRPPTKRWVDSLILANGFTAVIFYLILDIGFPAIANINFGVYPDIGTFISMLIAIWDGIDLYRNPPQKVQNKRVTKN